MPAQLPPPKILVIRGGAIGDFLLTLPAIALLRDAFPSAHLEILGYKHIVSLAEGRHYAHATRSIEYAGLASFFVPGADLRPDLMEYFAGFQQIVSYLYDPDGFFEANLRRAGVKHFLAAYTKIVGSESGGVHASRQLARPLERMALFLEAEPAAAQPRFHPSADDRAFASVFLANAGRPVLAVHPGSGGAHKLWPLEHWSRLLAAIRRGPGAPRILLAGGEADAERLATLRTPEDLIAWNLPLPHLGAVFERCGAFLGHDSGISHLAAAAETPSVLLFGPTDPSIWAPPGDRVRIVRATGCETGDLAQLTPAAVLDALELHFRNDAAFGLAFRAESAKNNLP